MFQFHVKDDGWYRLTWSAVQLKCTPFFTIFLCILAASLTSIRGNMLVYFLYAMIWSVCSSPFEAYRHTCFSYPKLTSLCYELLLHRPTQYEIIHLARQACSFYYKMWVAINLYNYIYFVSLNKFCIFFGTFHPRFSISSLKLVEQAFLFHLAYLNVKFVKPSFVFSDFSNG